MRKGQSFFSSDVLWGCQEASYAQLYLNISVSQLFSSHPLLPLSKHSAFFSHGLSLLPCSLTTLFDKLTPEIQGMVRMRHWTIAICRDEVWWSQDHTETRFDQEILVAGFISNLSDPTRLMPATQKVKTIS
jgi:hypothetical protein